MYAFHFTIEQLISVKVIFFDDTNKIGLTLTLTVKNIELQSDLSVISTSQVSLTNQKKYWITYDDNLHVFALGTGSAPSVGSLILVQTRVSLPPNPAFNIQPDSIVLIPIEPAKLLVSAHKFNPDGSAKKFLGNTIICNVDPYNGAIEALAKVQEKIRSSSFGYAYAYLPPPSFHVTVLSLVNDKNQQTILGAKPKLIDKWSDIHRVYYTKLERKLKLHVNTSVQVKLHKLDFEPHFGAQVIPADERSAQLMQQMKTCFKEASRIFPRELPLHVSLGYTLFPLMPHLKEDLRGFLRCLEQELESFTFTLQPPFFATFESMAAFAAYEK